MKWNACLDTTDSLPKRCKEINFTGAKRYGVKEVDICSIMLWLMRMPVVTILAGDG